MRHMEIGRQVIGSTGSESGWSASLVTGALYGQQENICRFHKGAAQQVGAYNLYWQRYTTSSCSLIMPASKPEPVY
jgi:hypothetical protein